MGSMFPYYSSQRLFLDDIIIIMDVESNEIALIEDKPVKKSISKKSKDLALVISK